MPRARKAPPNTGCTCHVGNGLRTCSRNAVVKVGYLAYCAQHAQVYGIEVPS